MPDVLELKTGKRDPVFPSAVPFLREVTMGKMPAVPSSVTAPSPPGGYGMLGNDQFGDCTIAGEAHDEMVFALTAPGAPSFIPNETQTMEAYARLSGDPTPDDPSTWSSYDNGLVIANVLAAARKNGIFSTDDELAGGAYTRLHEGSAVELHESIAYFGVAKMGIQCPQSAQQAAQQQMQTGQPVPWTYVKGSPIVGGHDIEFVGYDDTYFWAVSWGLVVPVTYSFVAHYADEGWCPLAKQFRVVGHGPMNIGWSELDAELDSIAA